jgi:hypothetical protein
MPLARLTQYQHCLLRRNAVRTEWGNKGGMGTATDQWNAIKQAWSLHGQSQRCEN